MCEVKTRAGSQCSRESRFWVQVALPPRITPIDGDSAGRSLLACSVHLHSAVRSISDCQRELLRGTGFEARPVTVKRRVEVLGRAVYIF